MSETLVLVSKGAFAAAVDGKISMDQGETATLPQNAIHPDRTEIYDRFVGQRRIALPGQEFGYFPKEILGTESDISGFDLLIRVGGDRIPVPSQRKLAASDPDADDGFGGAAAIHGDTVLVGSPGDDDAGGQSGAAYVFVRSGTSWSQQAKLTASDAAADDRFGISVSVNGDTAVIGAYGDDDAGSQSGSAYVFARDAGRTGRQQAKLTASDAAAGDYFGTSVSVNGDTAVVGAYGDDDAGQLLGLGVRVHPRRGTTWSQQAKLTASDAAAGDYFGSSVVGQRRHRGDRGLRRR